ncbi:ATP-dependent zinc metalloprotease FtsH [Granulicella sp. S156]|uniref:ATP-dependent zinc metalloprotease FtsH n=1 Tax=Granulicella sp. S156 TaxID=1747224 RepID=UPI00131EC6FE|nr:ATP-dependent zinc metalloprotease FtsH [Granulicella sp. S156]
MNSTVKQLLIWVFAVACILVGWRYVATTMGAGHDKSISMTDLLNDASAGKISEVTMADREVTGKYKDGKETFHTTIPQNYPHLYDVLQDHGVNIIQKDPTGGVWLTILFQIAPIAAIALFLLFMMRQMQSGGNKALSFGKNRARLLSMQQKKITFKDVAGVDEAKEELKEIIEFLREAQKFQRLGGRIPKGVLMVGPPGTGKTLLARAVAGEANVPFFSISGSDFVEMFVGVGASRVRDLFEQGKKNAPCIIFIDEIDAVGRHRGAGLGGGHDEREQTLNQLLVEMDGFESNDGVILIAATNRPDVLDPALLRPGRFDRRVIVDRPDIRGREEVLRVHSKKVPLSEDVNLGILARGTPGFSGADLANMVNEAALTAARFNRKAVHMYDFEVAKDKVLMGAERKSMLLSEDDKRDTAYHEAGHVLVAAKRDHSDPLHKVTIIPRGMALGVTMHLPEEDKHTVTKDYLNTQLAILMGGRCAEEIFMNRMTTGAGNDIVRATELARKMVCEYGMSELGPLTYGKKEEQIFLGREIAQARDYSDDTANQIDKAVRSLVDDGYKSAHQILEDNQDVMHRMAAALLERETLDAAEIQLLIQGKELGPVKSSLAFADGDGDTQKVSKPDNGRKTGFNEGLPTTA